jgi:protein SCO1/2
MLANMIKKLMFFSILSLLISFNISLAIEKPDEELKDVGLNTKLGTQVDLNLVFTTSDGQEKPLKEIIAGNKPILLTPVYYDCPRLCGLLLTGATTLFNQLNLKMGDDYEVLTVSFNPDETSELAKKRESEYKMKLNRPDSNPAGWHFLTGKKENISVLMQQIGFKYAKDGNEYAHTAAIIVLTAKGEISQYFTGIEFSPWDSKLSIIEASQGKMGSVIDHILLFCFRYDHLQGKYTWAVFNLVRVVGASSIVVLLAVVFWASRRKAVTL